MGHQAVKTSRDAVLVEDAALIRMMGMPVLEAVPSHWAPLTDPFILVYPRPRRARAPTCSTAYSLHVEGVPMEEPGARAQPSPMSPPGAASPSTAGTGATALSLPELKGGPRFLQAAGLQLAS